jgi:hypothetical protein
MLTYGRFRHAAALALVGWYLMVPPIQEAVDSACQWKQMTYLGRAKGLLRGGGDWNVIQCDIESLDLDDLAPLSRWQVAGTFDTKTECQTKQSQPLTASEITALEAQAQSTLDNDQTARPKEAALLPDYFVGHFVRTRQTAIQLSQCIATDDPRLKEK